MTGETVPLGPTEHLLQKATLPRLGGEAALSPNTQKQTQGGCQNEETKIHGPNEGTDQNSRKRAKQNGDKQSARCRARNMEVRMLNELTGRVVRTSNKEREHKNGDSKRKKPVRNEEYSN